MKLRSANAVRSFLYSIKEECAKQLLCMDCPFHKDICCMRRFPENWDIEDILKRQQSIYRKEQENEP